MVSSVVLSPRNIAMDYLSRRDHSRTELKQKLKVKGFDSDDIELALDKLTTENLINDVRFTQGFIRYRATKGIGPIKIYHELKLKGVSSEIIQQAEENEGHDWFEHLKSVTERKYGSQPAKDYKEKQKRSRFLQQRGFVMHDIMRLFA